MVKYLYDCMVKYLYDCMVKYLYDCMVKYLYDCSCPVEQKRALLFTQFTNTFLGPVYIYINIYECTY